MFSLLVLGPQLVSFLVFNFNDFTWCDGCFLVGELRNYQIRVRGVPSKHYFDHSIIISSLWSARFFWEDFVSVKGKSLKLMFASLARRNFFCNNVDRNFSKKSSWKNEWVKEKKLEATFYAKTAENISVKWKKFISSVNLKYFTLSTWGLAQPIAQNLSI